MRPHGIVRLIYRNDMLIEAIFKKDGITCYGRKIYSNGDYYIGNMVEGIESGQGTLVRTDGVVLRGTFKNGKLVLNN